MELVKTFVARAENDSKLLDFEVAYKILDQKISELGHIDIREITDTTHKENTVTWIARRIIYCKSL